MYKKIKAYEPKGDKNKILDIFAKIFTLKNTIRTGWVKYHGIEEIKAESIADHVYSLSTLAYLLAREYRPDLNADKVLKLGIFHEMGEVYGTDIAMRDFPDLEEKYKVEKESVKKVLENFKDRNEYLEYWEDVEKENTPEGKFVKQIDKFEAVLQAHLYNKEISMVDYQSFIKLSEDKFFDKEILELVEILKIKD